MKKILIVEDEVLLLKALSALFEGDKYEILLAHDGKEGLDMALNRHPDIILLDLIMPVMDGMTMLNKLREDQWGRDAKVIILTNLGDNEKLAEAMKNGTYDYLVKTDWNIEDVSKLVKQKIGE